jgi:hypothetical protein
MLSRHGGKLPWVTEMDDTMNGQAHLAGTAILKGWQSFSPGLRGTSYPGVTGQVPTTLKGLHLGGKARSVVSPRCAMNGLEYALTPALIVAPKVIHQAARRALFPSPQPIVNNFCATKLLTCEQRPFRLPKRRHAEPGRRITLPLSKDASGETFAPSSALWTKTNSQRSPWRRPSIRPSRVQSLA